VSFIESRTPIGGQWTWINELAAGLIRGWGNLCFCVDLLEECAESPLGNPQVFANQMADDIMGKAKFDGTKFEGQQNSIKMIEDVRWLVSTYTFLDLTDGRIFGPIMGAGFFLSESGAAVKTSLDEGHMAGFAYPFLDESVLGSDLGFLSRQLHLSMFFGFSLLHCKNVDLVEHAGEFASRQARRLASRRNEPEPAKYYTIEIGQMTRVLNTEGCARQTGLKKALHICRGHFSHYTEDKPLFGKYSGQFWIPAHVRGTTESGQIVKDYKVKAPRDVAA